MANPSEDWISLARLVKTQGRRGEFAADLFTDSSERFAILEASPQPVSLLHPTGRRQAFALASHWFHKGRVVLGFAGITDMNAAAAWIGAEVQVLRAQRPPAPAGSYYQADLEGCEVFDGGRRIGTIASIESIAGAAQILHVGGAGGRDHLIPFAAAYVSSISIPDRRVEMNLPEGLLDINQP